jgi:hypothetical protein
VTMNERVMDDVGRVGVTFIATLVGVKKHEYVLKTIRGSIVVALSNGNVRIEKNIYTFHQFPMDIRSTQMKAVSNLTSSKQNHVPHSSNPSIKFLENPN